MDMESYDVDNTRLPLDIDLKGDWNEEVEESECISQLIQADKDVNEGPAFKAVRDNDIPVISAIVFTGYDINTRNDSEDSPSSKKTYYEFRDWNRMARVLRLKGYTPLHIAVVHSNIKTIKFLLTKGADPNVSDANLMSPLSLAAAVQRADVSKLLIKAGAKVDSQSVSGRTPLLQAISNNNITIVRQLLRAGSNPDLADTKGTTPLFMCLQARRDDNENLRVMHALIDAGCQLDLSNKQGATALMLAVSVGRLDAAIVLLKAGADINARDSAGQNVMHMTSGTTTATFLLHNGATSDTQDNKGQTPLDKALSKGHISFINLFLEADSRRNSSLIDLPRVAQMRQQVPLFDSWLQRQFNAPRTLRRLCRQVIRQSMSPTNTSKIPTLPLPQIVKDFLLCKHLDLIFRRPQADIIPSSVPTLHP